MEAAFESGLKEICGRENVRKAVPMSGHTTFRTGGPADFFVTPENREAYIGLLSYVRRSGMDFFVLGKGSNLLVGDKGFRGTVIDTSAFLNSVTIEDETIKAEAGAGLGTVAGLAAERSLTGMEFASGIPGTVGGAVFMNAGAYGGEMSQIVSVVEMLKADGTIIKADASDMEFGYRTSLVQKEELYVISVDMQLQKGNRDDIAARIKDLGMERAKKQPLEYPSAGSTFKRPEGYYAGKLIFDAGLSGFSIGGACVSTKHNGFIINTGNATSKDILELIYEVKERVKKRSGIELTPEVRIKGEF